MAVKQLRQLAKGNNLCQPVGFAFRFREDFQKIFPDGIFHEKRLRILGQHTDAAGDGQLAAPTKGLDAEFKQVFGQILRTLQASGVAILMVSHDIEFCAKYADRCALFFDGNIVTEAEPRTFFSGNSFYTTAANRIARDVLSDAVTPEHQIVRPVCLAANG